MRLRVRVRPQAVEAAVTAVELCSSSAVRPRTRQTDHFVRAVEFDRTRHARLRRLRVRPQPFRNAAQVSLRGRRRRKAARRRSEPVVAPSILVLIQRFAAVELRLRVRREDAVILCGREQVGLVRRSGERRVTAPSDRIERERARQRQETLLRTVQRLEGGAVAERRVVEGGLAEAVRPVRRLRSRAEAADMCVVASAASVSGWFKERRARRRRHHMRRVSRGTVAAEARRCFRVNDMR